LWKLKSGARPNRFRVVINLPQFITNKGRSNDILLNETEHLVSFERNTLDNVRNSLINYQGSHKNELEGIFL
jgi:hypothetical protein